MQRRQRRRRSPSPEIEVNNSNVCVGKGGPTFDSDLKYSGDSDDDDKNTSGSIKQNDPSVSKPNKLPTSREEATWQLLSLFNTTEATCSQQSFPQQPQAEHHTAMGQALRVLRLYPELASKSFYCKNKAVYGKVSWLPLHHFVAANASVGMLKQIIKMNLLPTETGDDLQIYPLHVACRLPFVSDSVVLFLAEEYPAALSVASKDYGYPLHCLLHRSEQDDYSFEHVERHDGISLLGKVVELCPEVLSLHDRNGTGILEVAIHKGIQLDKLNYLVEQMPPTYVEMNLGEPATIRNGRDDDVNYPLALQGGHVQALARLFPQLQKLNCNIRHWSRDGMLRFFEFIPKATSLSSLQLELPDDIHLEHWNGAALQTLHDSLTQTMSTKTLRELKISLYSRMQDLMNGPRWSHEKIFLAIVTAFQEENNNINRLELHNFRLQDAANLGHLLASGAAPCEVELVNLSLEGRWMAPIHPNLKASRLQHLTIKGESCPWGGENDWLTRFLNELTRASLLVSLTLDFDHTQHQQNKDSSVSSTCSSDKGKTGEEKPVIDLTNLFVSFLRHASNLESLCVKGSSIRVDTPTLCKEVLQSNTSLTCYKVQGCLQDEESRASLAKLLEGHNRTLVELPEPDSDLACKWWHRIEFYLSTNRFRQLGIDLDPGMATCFPLPSCYY